jgi:glutathione synthase/RimK-type ligase-like ATP-grasp enzyme
VSRLAIATCAGDDVDVDTPFLLDACRRGGLDATMAVWDDPAVEWDGFDLTVIRSTWDYAPRRDEFLAWARRTPRVLNPYDVIEYSTDKHYLADLASRGVRVAGSVFCDVGATPEFPMGDFVVKPCVGAGSIDADRYSDRDHDAARAHVARLHAHGRDVVIQPYLHSVDVEGERAMVFIDGVFSHAMTKGAMLNVTQLDRNALFRREQMSLATAEPDALAAAEAALAAIGASELLYARVDLVRDEGEWTLMELELVEPSLFLSYYEPAADALVAAIARRLN